ncbi:MazG nucleotide pyrophosphohydrolase domain-containing protein [Shouchella sp. JSM 1781072]|uniref:MazG nucleotide pyrophosphohydrolase domain-containing protein n=1 Tax=Bacillaceae TaxID=186817 RepID=UPI000C07E474|nr:MULTISPECIES: MazG nucleotide pyrophosphohydrolase domain-containing protein [Bacillaceae]UTR06452.1 pyrophosphatase [Alkalihalobacillus sp. LMS6]
MEWKKFQQYVEDFCEEKGFDEVSDEERYLFFMSEVGEMAQEMLNYRYTESLEKKAEMKQALSHEIFDVIWNAVEIANRYEIDLTKAFSEKMEINRKRTWS